MAKAKDKPSAKLKERDKRTLSKIVELADDVSKKTLGGKEPVFHIPTRT